MLRESVSSLWNQFYCNILDFTRKYKSFMTNKALVILRIISFKFLSISQSLMKGWFKLPTTGLSVIVLPDTHKTLLCLLLHQSSNYNNQLYFRTSIFNFYQSSLQIIFLFCRIWKSDCIGLCIHARHQNVHSSFLDILTFFPIK